MSRFVLTAQLQLRAPTNTRQVLNQIQRQLGGGVNVNVNINNAARAQGQLNQLNNQARNLNTTGQRLGRTFGVALRRFTAFAVASRGVSLFTNKLGEALNEAIDFERELIKVAQVTGKTLKQLDGLSKTITGLSSSLGVSSKEILSTARILAQAGIQARDLDVALSALAKTSLSATFDDIAQTAEGAVALLAQFGQGVGALEKQLSQISSVAGQFAVESGDLIGAIRRTGGVFVSAGGDLEEFLGLFTSIRATTRESSESIATGLRTILTRIQRPKTIEFLKQFGVELTDLNGKFVGPYEAVRRLSQAFAGLEQGDITFVRVAEELGGFRQIGKVIPLIQQFEVAERARQAAVEGGNALSKEAEIAQQSLAVQFSKVREEFLALVRGISETGTFQVLVKTTLALTSQLIKLADAFKPLLPILGAFAAIRLTRGIGNFISGVGAGLTRRNAGGPIGFAAGGVVPGTGNRDTVPAMLTPGEFVIRKSSVQKIGADNLASMNAQKFASGGAVKFPSSKPYVKTGKETRTKGKNTEFDTGLHRFDENDTFKYNIAERKRINLENTTNQKEIKKNKKLSQKYDRYKSSALNEQNQQRGREFEGIVIDLFGLTKAAGSSSRIDALLNEKLIEIKSTAEQVSDEDIGEKMVGAAISPNSKNVDTEIQKKLTTKQLESKKPDTINLGSISVYEDITKLEGAKKLGQRPSERKRKSRGNFFGGAIQKFAKGGSPSDTVPALLTPGEFVVNAKAAASIGKANLDRMNKHGVAGFAAGGQVTRGRHTYGSPAAKGIAEEVIELLANASKAIPKPESSPISYNQDESYTPKVHQGFENYKFDQRSMDYRPGSSAGKAAREYESMQFSEKINFGQSYFGDPSKIQKISGETSRNGDEFPFSWEEVGGLDFSGITTPEIAMATLESGLDELFGSVKDVPAIVKQFGDSLLNTRDMMQSLSDTLHENGARISDDYNANEKIAEEKEKKKLPSGIAAAKREEIQKKEQEIINSPPTFQDFFARSPKDEETQDTPAQDTPEKKTEPIVARVSNLVDTINKSGEEAFRNIFEKIDRTTFSPNIKKVSAPVRKRPESEAFSTKVRKGASQFAKPASDAQIASFISGEKSKNVADPSKIKQGFGKTVGFTVGPATGFKAPTVEEQPKINRRETDLFEEQGIEQKRASSIIPEDFDPLSFDEKAGKEELKALTGRSSELARTTKSQEALANDKNVSPEISGLASALVDNTSAVTANDQVMSTLRQEYRNNNGALRQTKKAYEQAAAQSEAVKRQEQGGIDSRKGRIEQINSNLNERGLSDKKRSALLREKGNLQDGVAKREGEIAESEKPVQELAKQMEQERAARERVAEALLAAEDAETELLAKRKELTKTLEEQIVARRTSLKQSINASAQMDATAAGQTGTQSSFGEFSKTATEVTGAKKKEQKDKETAEAAAKKAKETAEAAAKQAKVNDLKSTFNVGKSAAKGVGSVSEKTSDCDECSLLQSIDNNIAVIRKTAGDIARLIAQRLGRGSTSTSTSTVENNQSIGSGLPQPAKADPPEEEETKEETKKEGKDLKSFAIDLLAVNAALSYFTTSGEEAAKKSFNFANALQAGLTQFIAVKAAMQQIKEYADNNLKKDDPNKGFFGNVAGAELDKESSLGKFFRDQQARGLKTQRRATNIQAKGQARVASSGRGVRGLGGKALGKSQQFLGKVTGGLGKSLGKLAGFASKFAAVGLRAVPVVGQVIGAITSISSALTAGFALQEKYNLAVKQGNVAKAQEYAALKDFTGIEQALGKFSPALAEASAFIRGTTIESLKANAKVAALAAKADLEKANNARLASDAMREVASGTMSLTDALSGAGSANFRGQLDVRRASVDANRLNSANRSEGASGVARSIGSFLSFGLIEGRNAKNERIKSENEDRDKQSKESLAKEFETILPDINKLGREFALSGGTLGEFEAKLLAMGIPLDEVEGASQRVARAFENNEKSIERNRKAFQALNFGLTPLLKTAQGLSSSLGTLTSISDGTYNALDNAKNVLETAATGGVVDDAAFQSALDTVSKELTSFGGGEQVGKITETISALRQGFEGAGPALEKFRAKLISGELDSGSPQELTKGLADTLTADIKDANAKKIIQDALADVEISKEEVEKILSSGDLSGLLKTLEEKGQEAFKELGPVIDQLVNSQNQLLSLTNKRIAAEQELINAQLSSADLQKEAATLIAEFSNKQLSADEQADLSAGRLRATGIQDQSAEALSSKLAVNTAVQGINAGRLNATGDAALGGQDRATTEASQQKLSTQNAEILTYARERVKIYQQEIAAAKQRLKLDQDAAKALLSGDISKFAESTNASIAASAFRMGDTSQLQGLSGEALAAGFDSLTDEEKAASAGTLESLGLSSGLADAAAGTSPEIEALQAEAIKYADIIAQSGDAGVTLAEASLTAAQNLETLGQQALATAEANAAAKQAELDAAKKVADDRARQVEEERAAKLAKEEAERAAEEKRLGDAAEAEAAALRGPDGQIRLAGGNSNQRLQQVGDGSDGWAGYVEGFMGLDRRDIQRRARGGTIYASRGMFIPRGTDTVPAMLTPGEFVVNRAAVQRGNNLQLLRAMNGGDTANNGAPAPSSGGTAQMAAGGMVGYFNEGGQVAGGMGEFVTGFSQAIGQLGSAFGTFAKSVENLSQMKLSVDLAPTSVNVNVIGPMLSELTEQTKEIVLNAVVSEIKLNQLGNLERTV
jgi:hypothetical protein